MVSPGYSLAFTLPAAFTGCARDKKSMACIIIQPTLNKRASGCF